MGLPRRGSSAAGLAALIAVVTMVPFGLLLWLGWRLVQQDQLLQHQQIVTRVDRGATLAINGLQNALDGSRRQLASGRRDWPDGAVAVRLISGSLRVYPRERVAFLPAIDPLPEARSDVFADAEQLEFVSTRVPEAMAVYRRLSNDPDRVVHVGAMLRLARAAQNAGLTDQALDTYGQIIDADDVGMNGVPAALIARYGRCRLFERLGQSAELIAEASRLADALDSARWPLVEPVYRLYAVDARRWRGTPTASDLPAERFGEAVTAASEQWRAAPRVAAVNDVATSLTIGDRTFAVLWHTESAETSALIADERFVKSEWIRAIAPIVESSKIILDLHAGTTDSAEELSGGIPRRVRTSAETGLPFDLLVTSVDPPPEATDFAARRRLLIAGMLLLVLMASAAGYFVVRAVSREMAVARLQSDFVAAVSHEFRTPLTSLRQFTEMLQENTALDDDRRRVAYAAQARAVHRLSRLVESLLDFGRIEAGTHRYVFTRCDCVAVVRTIVDDVRYQAEPGGHVIEVEGPATLTCEADEEALGRAVRNLLENAVKYSPEPSPIRVRIEKRDGTMRIAVADRGMGIPAAEQSAVFTRFHRGEEARIRGIKGTGIGLALVDEIMRAHRGHVDVISEVGHGSTFTLVLPLSQPTTETAVSLESQHLSWPES